MAEHPDQRYVSGLCGGDNQVIEEIYRTYSGQIQSWIRQHNGSADDAKDLFNEAILAIYDRYCGPDFVLSRPFGALLSAICRNRWLSQLRKKAAEQHLRNVEAGRYEEEQEEADLLVEAEEAVAYQDRRHCMEQTFRQLTERCQEVLTLLDGHGVPGEEVARRLDISDRNAVYVRAFECRRRWRQLFDQQCKKGS